ncbi:hypothetical protein AMIS_73630 [Actinoplanes missouriensis 431]|uniref:SIMPL domain-containing protein n=1 Tax=Actinoplanes missouriensis (strain ATCC 14538 / DSM 43046 / CBS 188.64 / JCM 3121 / NBRC 102363 / NCIMB 12654 / NRRL B-3342 / UNCC 431) TaxID=512565 RepID=I0HHU6_ACTM4|nr:SIMPL domain-containing protein [Actinoplanes missouriensis]BAL92583.1 hypothetical protein AMIS_73630 [Actinoplanes missouriensis 431]
MERSPVIVARGEAVREVPPEIAVVHVRTAAKGRDRESVLERLAERSAAITAALDGFAAAIERRETTGLHVHPQTKRRGEEIAAYHGSIGTQVLVTDFTVLGDLMLRLAAEELTTVDGPWWQLRPGSRAGAEARRAAITDALSRAAEYASAVGAEIAELVEINDGGAGLDDGYTPVAFAAGGARARGAESGPALDLEPEAQTVRAQVRVTVTISRPILPGRPTST